MVREACGFHSLILSFRETAGNRGPSPTKPLSNLWGLPPIEMARRGEGHLRLEEGLKLCWAAQQGTGQDAGLDSL